MSGPRCAGRCSRPRGGPTAHRLWVSFSARASRSTGSRVLSPHFVRNLTPHPFPSASLALSYFILLNSPFCSGSNGGLRLLRLTPGSQSISDQAEFQRPFLPTSTLNSNLKFSPCAENEQRAKIILSLPTYKAGLSAVSNYFIYFKRKSDLSEIM